jgi:hypothetical protein
LNADQQSKRINESCRRHFCKQVQQPHVLKEA